MIISDGKARRIAAEWHGGQTSGLCSFATTGAIGGLVIGEVDAEIDHLEAHPNRSLDFAAEYAANLADLTALAAYLEHHGERTPVPGWSSVWE